MEDTQEVEEEKKEEEVEELKMDPIVEQIKRELNIDFVWYDDEQEKKMKQLFQMATKNFFK